MTDTAQPDPVPAPSLVAQTTTPAGALRLEWSSQSPAETQALGARLASLLGRGDVLSLAGDLGAGKTCFVQGIAQGLGINEHLTSPSFLLRKDYPVSLADGSPATLAHLDIYRLDTFYDLDVIGLDEEPDAIWVIEWGDAAADALAAERLDIHLSYPVESTGFLEDGSVDQARTITIDGYGPDWQARLTQDWMT